MANHKRRKKPTGLILIRGAVAKKLSTVITTKTLPRTLITPKIEVRPLENNNRCNNITTARHQPR